MIGPPSYIVTADLDWASDFCIEHFIQICMSFDVKPTIFITHQSDVIDKYAGNGLIEVGLHPNFLPGSTHGETIEQVIDHVLSLYPQAQSYRSHSYVDSTPIQLEFLERGITYESNMCLTEQANIQPLNLATGLTRYPVFFEDDVHCMFTEQDKRWDFDRLKDVVATPGLKVMDFHPFLVAANISSIEEYNQRKHLATTFGPKDAAMLPEKKGTATMLREILSFIRDSGHKNLTLAEAHKRHKQIQVPSAPTGEAPVVDGCQETCAPHLLR